MKPILFLLSLLVVGLFLVGCTTGEVGRRQQQPACVWVDRYSDLSLDHTPLNRACITAGLTGYAPVAYELRRDFRTYLDNTCQMENLVTEASDHQILKSYGATEPGATVPNFGEEVGNIDICQQTGSNLGYYEQIFQTYDGALCCRRS